MQTFQFHFEERLFQDRIELNSLRGVYLFCMWAVFIAEKIAHGFPMLRTIGDYGIVAMTAIKNIAFNNLNFSSVLCRKSFVKMCRWVKHYGYSVRHYGSFGKPMTWAAVTVVLLTRKHIIISWCKCTVDKYTMIFMNSCQWGIYSILVFLLGIFRRVLHQGAPLCPFTFQGAPCPLKKNKIK
jgi:hypothetical protein